MLRNSDISLSDLASLSIIAAFVSVLASASSTACVSAGTVG
jgi:hypothetical protein